MAGNPPRPVILQVQPDKIKETGRVISTFRPVSFTDIREEPLEFVHFLFVLVLGTDDDVLELLLTGTSRDEMSADDILLESLEVIHTTSDGCLRENLRGLLEGSGRDE